MDLVANNLFEIKGTHYLLVVDVYTGFPWYKWFCKTPDTWMVTEGLDNIFLVYRYHKHHKCDGGGQYRAEFKGYYGKMFITQHNTSTWNHESNGEAEKAVSKVNILMKKVVHGKGDFRVAISRLIDASMCNSKMRPARQMFRRALRFPGLPALPDGWDEFAAGEEKQAAKVAAKERRNSKTFLYGKSVVEFEEGLHILLQDMDTNLFDI